MARLVGVFMVKVNWFFLVCLTFNTLLIADTCPLDTCILQKKELQADIDALVSKLEHHGASGKLQGVIQSIRRSNQPHKSLQAKVAQLFEEIAHTSGCQKEYLAIVENYLRQIENESWGALYPFSLVEVSLLVAGVVVTSSMSSERATSIWLSLMLFGFFVGVGMLYYQHVAATKLKNLEAIRSFFKEHHDCAISYEDTLENDF